MKKVTVVLSVLLLIGAASLFATNAKKGETWLIEYTVQWDDTYEILTQGILTYTHQANTQKNLEAYAREKLGWSAMTKRVKDGDKMRTQRLILNCVKSEG